SRRVAGRARAAQPLLPSLGHRPSAAVDDARRSPRGPSDERAPVRPVAVAAPASRLPAGGAPASNDLHRLPRLGRALTASVAAVIASTIGRPRWRFRVG